MSDKEQSCPENKPSTSDDQPAELPTDENLPEPLPGEEVDKDARPDRVPPPNRRRRRLFRQ